MESTKVKIQSSDTNPITNIEPKPIEPKQQFAKKISMEEYNKQSEEYTKNKLKELNSQIKTKIDDHNDNDNDTNGGKIYKRKHESNKYDFSNDDESDYDLSGDKDDKNYNDDSDTKDKDINLIIEHLINSKKLKQSKSNSIMNNNTNIKNNNDLNNTDMQKLMYNAHNNDIKKIKNLEIDIIDLKRELNEAERKIHFLTLDLSNIQCDKDNLLTQNKVQKNEIYALKLTEKNNINEIKTLKLYLQVYKMILKIFICLYVFYQIFKLFGM